MNADESYAAAYHLEFWGTVEDLPEIERLYRAAAAAGSVDAMARLGLVVEGEMRATMDASGPGKGVGNLGEAAGWYRKAAEAGHAQAAFFLGRLYADKLGDWARAEPWFRAGAAGGNDAARERLAEGPEGLVRRRELDLWLSGHAKEPPRPASSGCVVLALLPILSAVLALVANTA
ncbi:hypothetical protein GCM10027258_60500 [Amycolatopsis stemonae]